MERLLSAAGEEAVDSLDLRRAGEPRPEGEGERFLFSATLKPLTKRGVFKKFYLRKITIFNNNFTLLCTDNEIKILLILFVFIFYNFIFLIILV